MAHEAQCTPEASEVSLEEEQSIPSTRSDARSYTSESEEDKSSSTKGGIKILLVELRKVWRAYFQKVQMEVEEVHQKVQGLEARDTSREENLWATHHTLQGLTSQVQQLRHTVTTMEARHRSKNLCLKGLPETVNNAQLLPYIHNLITAMGIRCSTDIPQITTSFRVWKSVAAPSEEPRDVIKMTRDISVRSAKMTRAREMGTIPNKGHMVAIYPDTPFSVLMEKKKTGTYSQDTKRS
ncbi:Hypothetical predicted protein [Pelobates cultripes]|uniref:Uncharacterized protein n=1 Tax=Pelobates cultripes TaxID=61616 RepID=A0AAD1VSD3_PELCU|nr:Hypothetical predicted protein [Pelobates cultripes]